MVIKFHFNIRQQEENSNRSNNNEHEERNSPISEQTFNNFHSLQEANKIVCNLSTVLPELPVSQFMNAKPLNELQDGEVLQKIRGKKKLFEKNSIFTRHKENKFDLII